MAAHDRLGMDRFGITRRDALRGGLAAGAALGLGDLGFLSELAPVSADDAKLAPGTVQLDPSIEPLVRLIEQTPRARLLEEIGSRIKAGLSYQELLAALLLAGVRNVQPRPSVGFKFHAVLVVNSAHLASLASPPEHRWLPIFWALDNFKSSAARDEEEGNWTMAAVDESAVPPGHKAHDAFVAAMENWDEAAADAAVAGLARTAGTNQLFDLFCRYGARDFRSIGHKAIFVANGFRTLRTIGRQHAEPVLRSLAYALLMHEGGNPAERDAEADRPYRKNLERVKSIRPEWRDGKLDDGATQELLQALRTGSHEETCDLCVELLNKGVSAQSLWDGMLVGAGELLMRQPAIVALHAVTTSNALRYAFEAAGNDEARLLALLQNAAFLPMFRESMQGRGKVADVTIDDLKQVSQGTQELPPILEAISSDPMNAARQTLFYLNAGETAERATALIDAARVQIFLKGTDSHDYKFSSAVLEDYAHVSPTWRNTYLATSVFKLRGTGGKDNGLVERARAALA
ncbi:MAG: hypothetical protein WBC44_02515 [Planctomycetaceae bacterium]